MDSVLIQSAHTAHADDTIRRPAEKEVRDHLDVILASEQFCTSKRASEFLQFVVDHALQGDLDSLKERLLGIEIFHRRSDYDTSSDAIVRVTANDVRRRLTQFDHAHHGEPVRILLPPGSYVPDFIKHDSPSSSDPLKDPLPELIERRTSASAVDPIPPPATPPIVAAPQTLHAPAHQEEPPRQRGRNIHAVWLAAAVLVALPAGWWANSLFSQGRTNQTQKAVAFYADILGPIGARSDGQTQIALSNPHVAIYRGTESPTPEKTDEIAIIPVPANLAHQLNTTANDTQGEFPFHYLQIDNKNYTGLGEAEAAFGLAKILGATGRSARLTQARFLNWDAAREQELVILGAPHMSSFAQSSLKTSNFVMEHDSIRNQHPLPGEQAVYNRRIDGSVLEDYGLIWMGKSPAGSRVLVLAGLTSTGTAGAGQFFADPARMHAVYTQLKSLSKSGSFPESWQVLLRIDAREDVPVATTAIAVRVLDDH